MNTLIAYCQACDQPIVTGTGILWIEPLRAIEAMAETERFEAGELLDLPAKVLWQIHHHRCVPAGANVEYSIEVERIAAWAQLTEWTAHLMTKTWLPATSWADLLRATAAGRGFLRESRAAA